MGIFSGLFGSAKNAISCPRCLGKGHVDAADIKRLKKELIWAPGKCAYCNATGTVDPGMTATVAVDMSYLTTDLSKAERQRVIDKDPYAVERGLLLERQVKNVIQQISYLYFTCSLDPDQIAEFYLISDVAELQATGSYEREKGLLVDYVHKVIEFKSNDAAK